MNVFLAAVGTAGDVFPLLGVGRALAQRGHRTTILANEHFESAARGAGLGFLPLGRAEGYRALTKTAFQDNSYLDAVLCLRKGTGTADPADQNPCSRFNAYVASEIAPLYETLMAACTREPTVVVAHSLAFGAQVARDRLGFPLALAHLAPSILPSDYQPAPVPADNHLGWLTKRYNRLAWWGTMHVMERALGSPVQELRERLNLAPKPVFSDAHELILGLFPDWFAPRLPDWPEQLVFGGFPLYDGPQRISASTREELEQFFAGGSAPVIVTPGTGNSRAPELIRASIDACARLGRRVLLLTPHKEQLPDALPAHVKHFDFLPLGAILPRAAAVLHHGGIGTSAQAIASGTPQLIIPQAMASDQPDNAARLVRLGVGLTLPRRRMSGDTVAENLRSLLESPEIADACRALAMQQRDEGEAALERACIAIEDLDPEQRNRTAKSSRQRARSSANAAAE